jgi:hypothetical protein
MAPKECIGVDKELYNGLDNYILAFDALADLCPIIKSLKRGPVCKAPAEGGDFDPSSDSEEDDAMDQVQTFVRAPVTYWDRYEDKGEIFRLELGRFRFCRSHSLRTRAASDALRFISYLTHVHSASS